MKKRSREISPPDLTPLIDVVFLLLTFFIVSTVFRKEEFALSLNLPKTSSTEKGQGKQTKEKIFIELTQDDIAINGKKTSLDELSNHLESIKDKTTPIDMRIDKKVKYEKIISVFDLLKKIELNNLSLITEEK